MGAPEVPPLCRETQSLGQHMLELFFFFYSSQVRFACLRQTAAWRTLQQGVAAAANFPEKNSVAFTSFQYFHTEFSYSYKLIQVIHKSFQ